MPSAQAWADLFLGANPLLHGKAEEGMPPREIPRLSGARRLAGIHDDHALGMFDDPGIDGQRLRPPAVEQGVEPADQAVPLAAAPTLGDGDGPGLDGMDAHTMSASPSVNQ